MGSTISEFTLTIANSDRPRYALYVIEPSRDQWLDDTRSRKSSKRNREKKLLKILTWYQSPRDAMSYRYQVIYRSYKRAVSAHFEIIKYFFVSFFSYTRHKVWVYSHFNPFYYAIYIIYSLVYHSLVARKYDLCEWAYFCLHYAMMRHWYSWMYR